MSVGILKRIRHYPERFRHLKYTWVLGSLGGSIPGVDAGVDAGDGTIYFGGKRSPNIAATINVAYSVDVGIDPGPGTPTPGSVSVAIPPLTEPAEQAALVAAALNGEALLTASAAGRTVSVAATDAANNALLSINVTGGVDTVSAPPTTVAELDVSVDFMADVRKAEITVNDKAPDVATTVRFRATFESGESIIVGAAIAAGLTKANAAKAIAQALNAEDMLTADSSRAVAEVIGQGSNVLTDFVKL